MKIVFFIFLFLLLISETAFAQKKVIKVEETINEVIANLITKKPAIIKAEVASYKTSAESEARFCSRQGDPVCTANFLSITSLEDADKIEILSAAYQVQAEKSIKTGWEQKKLRKLYDGYLNDALIAQNRAIFILKLLL